MIRKLLTVLAFGSVMLTGALAPANAQNYPPPPGYDRTFRGDHHIQGRVTAFGGFNLVVGIQGIAQPVNLHQGTILRPLGLTIVPGMLVRCDGHFNGYGTFVAEQIVLVR